MTGTPYVVLCLVQENGQKKAPHEHSSHNPPPAGAPAAECDQQVCSPPPWEPHQRANSKAADVVMLMRHSRGHPAAPPAISKPTWAKCLAREWLLTDAMEQITTTTSGHSHSLSCWVINRKNREWFTLHAWDGCTAVAVLCLVTTKRNLFPNTTC